MQIPQIQINSQAGKIGLQTMDAKQEIRQPKAELSIEQPKATVSINTQPGKLSIDQTQAWEDMNQMHVTRLTEKFAQEGKNKLLEGIGRRASQGTQLVKIENGGNPLVSQAVSNAFGEMKSLNITFIPSSNAVKLNYQPATVDVQVERNKPNIQANPGKVVHNYQPGNVDVQMEQYPEIDIQFINIEI